MCMHKFQAGLSIIVLMASIFATSMSAGQISPATDSILYVDVEATGANNGTSWEDAFTDLQPALDAAVTDDQIWVAAGTYLPTVEHCGSGDRYISFQLKNGVGVYGGFDPSTGDMGWDDRDWESNETILSGDLGVLGDTSDNSYHVFCHSPEINLDYNAILDGFTITGGNADNPDDINFRLGAGMINLSSSPTLSNLTISDNTATGGGGIYNLSSSPALTNLIFSNNSVGWLGGGMYNEASMPTLNKVLFQNNSAEYGGGIVNGNASPTLLEVIFSGNTAWKGGGMFNSNSSPYLMNVTFTNNSAFGAGMNNDYSSSPILVNTTFYSNTGDGMVNSGSSSANLTNVTFFGNTGRGIYNSYSSVIQLNNVTFSGNLGGGFYSSFSSPAILNNCILWGDAEPEIATQDPASVPVVTYSDVQGGYEGEGNIESNPLLRPLFNNGGFVMTLSLDPGSHAVDGGNPDLETCPATDARGELRPFDGDGDGVAICDMGAYEAQYVPFSTFLPVVVK